MFLNQKLQDPNNLLKKLDTALKTGGLENAKHFIPKDLIPKNINKKYKDGNTLLHYAVLNNNHIVVKFLLEKSANPNIENNFKQTALHTAVKKGNIEIVRILIENKADLLLPDINGNKPLKLANIYKHAEIAELIEKIFKDRLIQAVKSVNLTQVKTLISKLGTSPDDKLNESGNTLLHYAAKYDRLDIVKYLIEEEKINPNIPGKNNNTPLHYAAKYGHKHIVEYLTKNNAEVYIKNNRGNTPIHLATLKSHLNVIKCLIEENNVDPNIAGQNNNTPLHIAAGKGHEKIVQYLIKNNANVTAINKDGNTPEHLAASHRHLNIANDLKKCDTLVTEKTSNETPLCIVKKRSQQMINYSQQNMKSSKSNNLKIAAIGLLLIALGIVGVTNPKNFIKINTELRLSLSMLFIVLGAWLITSTIYTALYNNNQNSTILESSLPSQDFHTNSQSCPELKCNSSGVNEKNKLKTSSFSPVSSSSSSPYETHLKSPISNAKVDSKNPFTRSHSYPELKCNSSGVNEENKLEPLSSLSKNSFTRSQNCPELNGNSSGVNEENKLEPLSSLSKNSLIRYQSCPELNKIVTADKKNKSKSLPSLLKCSINSSESSSLSSSTESLFYTPPESTPYNTPPRSPILDAKVNVPWKNKPENSSSEELYTPSHFPSSM